MKKNWIERFKGFSLVELMISLITISLITAAFAPIVTKKLSSMGITVGSFGGGNGTNTTGCTADKHCNVGYYLDENCVCQKCNVSNCNSCDSTGNYCTACKDGFVSDGNGGCVTTECTTENEKLGLEKGAPSEKCCKSVGAIFVPASKTGGKDLCMMKYNAGDYDTTTAALDTDVIPYDLNYAKLRISVVRGKTDTCTNSPNCCWKGNTSKNASGTYSYSGDSRTLCQKQPAIQICSNWAYGGSKVGAWRLLKNSEVYVKNQTNNLSSAIAAETEATSETNLTKYKDNVGKSGLQLCDSAAGYGSNYCSYSSWCAPAATVSNTADYCAPYGIWLNDSGTAMFLQKGVIAYKSSDMDDKRALGVRCVSENVFKAVNSPEVELPATSDTEPLETSEDAKRLCPQGTMYINKLYTGGSKSICMMKYNAGDDIAEYNNYHPDYSKIGVAMLNVGDVDNTCKAVIDKNNNKACCWYGETSPRGKLSPHVNIPYGPTMRTVCQKKAAELICDNWGYNGTKGIWRLLTQTEATKLASYIKSDGYYSGYFARYLGSGGLQLCDGGSNEYGSNYCPASSRCIGAATVNNTSDHCAPYGVWTETDKFALWLSNGVAKAEIPTSNDNNRALSVRCVTDQIGARIEEHNPILTANEPSSQADCDKYNAIFIDKIYLNKIFNSNVGRNLCMMRWNFGDDDAAANGKPYYTDYMAIQSPGGSDGVTMVNTGTKCSSNYCCWKGNISPKATGNYTYSGANRTVCTQPAATKICASWAPDSVDSTGQVTSNGKWRLLNTAEATALAYYISVETKKSSFISKYLDGTNVSGSSKGLQLCDQSSSNYGANYCPYSEKCIGAPTVDTSANRCSPYGVWTAANMQALWLNNGVATVSVPNSKEIRRPLNVRCVTDTIKK